MVEFVLEDKGTIPGWVRSHVSFRRWAHSDGYPESGQYGWLNGKVWVDLSMERHSHNQIKTRVGYTLTGLSDRKQLGTYWGDRMLLTHLAAGLSTEPDGTFATWDTLRANRLRLIGGEPPDGIELMGTPDMVLEVVSRTSVHKDLNVLPDLYWAAGIPEFWLIDPRGPALRLDLFRHTAAGYRAVRARDGWRKSAVFGAAFRLVQSADPLGQPAYELEVR
jgi:Uma2 family endonuclease